MKVIKYEFADGTVSDIEVSDGLFAAHEELVKAEKRNHWKNTRRHISLDYLREHEIDIEDKNADPLKQLIGQEDSAENKSPLSALSDERRELLELVYTDGKTLTEIAKMQKVSQPAISQRLITILKKLQKDF